MCQEIARAGGVPALCKLFAATEKAGPARAMALRALSNLTGASVCILCCCVILDSLRVHCYHVYIVYIVYAGYTLRMYKKRILIFNFSFLRRERRVGACGGRRRCAGAADCGCVCARARWRR